MEETAIYRRRQQIIRNNYSLTDKFIILLRTHKDIKLLCTRTSVAIRIACLCNLVLKRTIGSSELANSTDNCGTAGNANSYSTGNAIEIYRDGDNEIEKEVINKMRNIKGDIRTWFKALNGEKEKEVYVKSFRKKVYRDMESRGIIKIKKGIATNKIILLDQDAWRCVMDEVVGECESKLLHCETQILLVLLNYVNQIESLRVHCNVKSQRSIGEVLEAVILKIKSGSYGTEIERLVNVLLRELI